MITAVDTSVLLDIFLPDPDFGEKSASRLESCIEKGSVIISEIVYAELIPHFELPKPLDKTLKELGVRIIQGSKDSASLAGERWLQYRKAGGKRNRILTDFLIGAHAAVHADCFLTRDRGFFKKYFSDLNYAA